jgi:chromosome partitioning protein
MTKVISFINYKGGVGKTTTTYHIGCSLAIHHRRRVLLVDIDPQTNLTFLCAIYDRWDEFKKNRGTIASLYRSYLRGEAPDTKQVIWKSPIEQAGRKVVPTLDLIPSDVELLGIDLDLQSKSRQSQDLKELARFHIQQRSILRRALETVIADYDYVLIDCPPNLYLVTQNALAASDSFVVTTIPDHLSTVGLEILRSRAEQLAQELQLAAQLENEKPCRTEIGGIIFVRARLGGSIITRAHTQIMERIRKSHPYLCFANYTTEGIGYTEAAELAVPVFLMTSSNALRVSEQYQRITDEFAGRWKP